MATLDPVLNRWEYMCLHASDGWTRSHVHLQRGTGYAWVNYLVKYQFKNDAVLGLLEFADDMHAFGLKEEVSLLA
jgi:hypothetical protein